jgi:small subunit ribosomal protein S27Ae
MKLLVRSNNDVLEFGCDPDDTIKDLKTEIENREFIPVNLINLIKGSALLSDHNRLSDIYRDGDELEFVLSLNGGMRQKWKKKRMRRMKRHRRKMRNRSK